MWTHPCSGTAMSTMSEHSQQHPPQQQHPHHPQTWEPRTALGCWQWLSGRSGWDCVLQEKRSRRLLEPSAVCVSLLAG